jgi:hypothetical protein
MFGLRSERSPHHFLTGKRVMDAMTALANGEATRKIRFRQPLRGQAIWNVSPAGRRWDPVGPSCEWPMISS